MPDDWPFDDPENLAVFTLKRIVRGESPILRVCHDEDDGGWQFLDGGEVAVEEASLVCAPLDHGRSTRASSNSPTSPSAGSARRASPGEPWQRAPAVTEEDQGAEGRLGHRGVRLARRHDPRGRRGACVRLLSIGLFKIFGHPEVIVFGLGPRGDAPDHQPDRRGGEAGTSVRRGRGRLGHPRRLRRAVPRGRPQRHYAEYLGYASWFYKGDDFPALQCLWPDKQGRFPTDAGFPESLRARQPLLAP